MAEYVDTLADGSANGTLADRLSERLVQAIVAGDLAAGSKISEPELAQRFGTSRGPLREALNRLEGLRLVERRPNQGARVVEMGRGELVELYAVREALEGMACRLAATHMSDGEIAGLRELLIEHERWAGVEADQSYLQPEGDLDVHYRLVQGSGNRQLEALLIGQLYHRVRMYRFRSGQVRRRPQRALKEHHQIVDAIERRDGELAELLMRRHIQAARVAVESEL
jgi:DNA-binding GntR family transcriptional regulator